MEFRPLQPLLRLHCALLSAHPPVAPVLQAVQGSDAMAQHTPPPSAAVSPVPLPDEPLPPEDPLLLVGVGSVPMKRPPHAPTASAPADETSAITHRICTR
jgi:hypothetical protein